MDGWSLPDPWRGKIKKIHKKDSSIVVYGYDATGNRISKSVGGTATYYVRDATGNVMSVYEKADTLKQKEVHLYSLSACWRRSSRLGILQTDTDVQTCSSSPPEISIFTRGMKMYELTNYFGNVLATVGDRKLQHSGDGTSIDYYTADVGSAHNNLLIHKKMPKQVRQDDPQRG